MNLTSFLANKCFEYLLRSDLDQANENRRIAIGRIPAGNTPSCFTTLPPWAPGPQDFKQLCNGCGDCVSHCENSILILRGGYPVVDFSRGPCSFCGACARSCSRKALHYDRGRHPWNLLFFITPDCLMQNSVVCSTCREQCDRGAIVLPRTINNSQKPVVIADKCNGCGACFRSCPVGAIAFQTIPDRADPDR